MVNDTKAFNEYLISDYKMRSSMAAMCRLDYEELARSKPVDMLIGRVEKRSQDLCAEMWKHIHEVQKANPEMTDEVRLGQGWLLQKVAALQILVEDLHH